MFGCYCWSLEGYLGSPPQGLSSSKTSLLMVRLVGQPRLLYMAGFPWGQTWKLPGRFHCIPWPTRKGKTDPTCCGEVTCMYWNGKYCRQLYLETVYYTKRSIVGPQKDEWECHYSTNSSMFKSSIIVLVQTHTWYRKRISHLPSGGCNFVCMCHLFGRQRLIQACT